MLALCSKFVQIHELWKYLPLDGKFKKNVHAYDVAFRIELVCGSMSFGKYI